MNIYTNSSLDHKLPDLWEGADPELQFENPRLAELLDYWKNKCQGRTMPSRTDIDPFDLKRHLGNIALIDVEHAGADFRLRYRLVGSNITALMDRDVTNRYYDEIYDGNVMTNVNTNFRWIFNNLAPLRSYGQADPPGKSVYSYEILNLPLSENGKSVNMVLGEMVFSLSAPA